jgi:hypothetical protein
MNRNLFSVAIFHFAYIEGQSHQIPRLGCFQTLNNDEWVLFNDLLVILRLIPCKRSDFRDKIEDRRDESFVGV